MWVKNVSVVITKSHLSLKYNLGADTEIKGRASQSVKSSVQSLIHVWILVTPWTVAHQASLSIPRVYSDSYPLSQWRHPTVSSSVIPFSSCLQSFPASESFPMIQFFVLGGEILEFQFQHHQSFQWVFRTDFLLDWLVGSPCSPRDSQDSSPTPQFKSISSWVLSFLYSPALIYIHEYWKNHSFGQIDLCWQSNVSAFEYAI